MADEFGFESEFTSPDTTGGSTPSILSFQDYSRSRAGSDPFEVYRDYVGTVFPSYLKQKGYNPQQIQQTQVKLMQQFPPPKRSATDVEQDFQARDEGILGNAFGAIGQSYRQVGSQLEAAKARVTGDDKALVSLLKEQQQLDRQTPPSLRKFRDVREQTEGNFFTKLGTAIGEAPEGALDAFLGMLTGFTPIIGAGLAGGAAGSVVPVVGNVGGMALGMGGASGAIRLGSEVMQRLQKGLADDKINPADEAAVYSWLKEKGMEKVFGPADKAAYTDAVITTITGGVSGRLTQAGSNLLENMAAKGAGASAAEIQGLRQGVRNTATGALASNVGGFAGASIGGTLAAGDIPRSEDVIEEALTMVIPSLIGMKVSTGKAKKLQREIEERRVAVDALQDLQTKKVEEVKQNKLKKGELTEKQQEEILRAEEAGLMKDFSKEEPPLEDAVATLHVAENLVREVENARYEAAQAKVKAELEARQGKPAPTTEPVEQQVEQRAADESAIDPTLQPGTSVPDQAEFVNQPRAGIDQEGIGEGVSGQPRSGEQGGTLVADSEAAISRPVVSDSDGGRQADVRQQSALNDPTNPASVKPAHEVANVYRELITGLQEDLTHAQIRGDTRAEVAIQENIAKLNREAKDWIQVTADLEAENFKDAITRLVKNQQIKEKDVLFYRALADRDTRSALELLAKSGKDLRHRVLAKQFLKIGIVPEARFIDHEVQSNLGTYVSQLDTVALDSGYFLQRIKFNDIGSLEGTLLHEIAHAGTVNALSKAYRYWSYPTLLKLVEEKHPSTPPETQAYIKTDEYKAAVKLFETFEWLKNNKSVKTEYGPLEQMVVNYYNNRIAAGLEDSKARQQVLDWATKNPQLGKELAEGVLGRIQENSRFEPRKHYGATNPIEMVAEVFVNPAFQNYLKTVTLPKELTGGLPKNAWQWVLDALKNILGLRGVENNALDAIMANTSQVMRERTPLEGMSKYNRSMPSYEEGVGLRKFYDDYPPSNTSKPKESVKDATDKLREELKRGGNPAAEAAQPNAPHNAIKGVDDSTSQRTSIAYRQKDGKFNYYQITEEYPTGDPQTKQVGLTHDQVKKLVEDAGHRVESMYGPEGPAKPRSGLQGWKDGTWQFGAIALKDDNGKLTGKYRVTTSEDLGDNTLPRERVTVDNYDEVRRLFGEGGFDRTRRASEARMRAEETDGLPELKFLPQSDFVRTIADKEADTKALGEQARYQTERLGLALTQDMRPDVANIRKNSLIQNDTERLVDTRLKPLETEGRQLVRKYKRTGLQFDQDISRLAYVDRATKKLASPTFDATPDAKARVIAQLAEANQYLSTLTPSYRAALERYAKKWKGVSDAMYDYLADAGLMTHAQANTIKSQYDFYVPMRTDEKSTTGKRATGLSDESTTPLLRIVNDWRLAIKRKYENEETKAVYNLAKTYNIKLPNGEKLFEIGPIHEYKVDPATGDVMGWANPLVMDRDSVSVFVNGTPYRMRINDKGLLHALERVPADQVHQAINSAMRGMAVFNAIYGGLKTAASPVFAIKNFIRDTGAAVAQGDARMNRIVLGGELVNPKIWVAAFKEAAGPWMKSKDSEAKQQGALISRRGIYGLNPEQDRPTVNLDPTMLQRAGEVRKNLFSFEHGKVSNLMTFMTKTTENVTRMAVYSAAMKSPKMWQSVGRSNGTTGHAVEAALLKTQRGQSLTTTEKKLLSQLQAEAAVTAKTATVNFEPKGKISGPVNAMFVFANAKTQGARTYLERLGVTRLKGGDTLSERLARGNRWTQYGTLSALSMGIASALYGYENDPENYGNMSDYQKDDYFTLKSGGLSVPIPQEISLAYTLGQSLVDAHKNPRWADSATRRAKAASRFATRMIQSFWPGGSAMSDPIGSKEGTTSEYISRLPTPTAVQLMKDLAGNRTTFNRPIVTGLHDGKPPKGVPLYEHNKEKVSPLAKGMVEAAHAGGVDIPPQKMQYTIDQFVKQNVDFIHSVAPTWEFFNSIFGAPKKAPDGSDRPNSLKKTFFQEASPLADKETLDEVIARENNKLHDAGQKTSDRLNMLKQGEKRAADLFRGYDKMTPEQIERKSQQAQEIRRNTLKRYRDAIQQSGAR